MNAVTSTSGTPALLARVDALVRAAIASTSDPVTTAELDAIIERLHEPLRVAIAGKVKAGKSTLLNALVGEVLAATDAGECTRVVTWYREGPGYRARVEPRNGAAVPVAVRRDGAGIEFDLAGYRPEDIERVVVDWPAAVLGRMTLIDTPGVGSLSGLGAASTAFVDPEDGSPSAADAVLFLTPHLHGGDVRFLEAFHDAEQSPATPVSALAVLSRADEIGGGRADAMQAAARIADRYRLEPSLRRLCQTVIPVAGLVAQAGATLTEGEFRAVVRLAQAPLDDLQALLLSADRFGRDEGGLGLAPDERRHLLDRLGLWGVRVATALVRSGQAPSAPRLAQELTRRSGLDDLRTALATRFSGRRDVLKSRSALLALANALRRHPFDRVDELRAELERLEATAHEFAELRVLLAVRAGAVPLDPVAMDQLESLLGTNGDAATRLGIDEPSPEGVHAAVVDAVQRWRARAEHPLATPALVETSHVVVRTLERIHASVGSSLGGSES